MKKIFLLYIALFTNLLHSQSILMVINDDTIYTNNFEKETKNSLEVLGTKATIDNYINFQLLEQYSKKLHIDTTFAFNKSLYDETKNLRDSLYYDPKYLEPYLKDYYNKLATERKFQLLIFKNEDINNRHKLGQLIINKTQNNSNNFIEEIDKYSYTDFYKLPKYYDIFSLDKELLDILYSTPLNQVTEFTTNEYAGLLLVTQERKSLGSIIGELFYIEGKSNENETIINQIHQDLNNNLSSTRSVRTKYLQYLSAPSSTRVYVDTENDVVYNYIANAQTAPVLIPPIETEKGYAIYIYLFKDYDYSNYAIVKKEIYNKILNTKGEIPLNNELIKEIKSNSFYKENTKEIELMINTFPGSFSKFQKEKSAKEIELINIGDEHVLTHQQLLDQMKKVNESEYKNIKSLTQSTLTNWINISLLAYYDKHFNETDRIKPEWELLKKQILMESAISIISLKAVNDIPGQKEYIANSSLIWEERFQGTLYLCFNTEVEKEVMKLLKQGKSADFIEKQFENKTDEEDNKLLVIDQGRFTKDAVNLSNVDLKKKTYALDYNSKRLIVKVDDIIKNDSMTLDELQKKYINEYINYKLDKTIKELREEAIINTNETEVNMLGKKYN